MELARRLGASAMPFEQHEARLAEFDIVVCATSAPGTVVSLSAAEAAIRKRPARPLFLIDLALPRDVDAGGRPKLQKRLSLQSRRPRQNRRGKPRRPRSRDFQVPRHHASKRRRKPCGVRSKLQTELAPVRRDGRPPQRRAERTFGLTLPTALRAQGGPSGELRRFWASVSR